MVCGVGWKKRYMLLCMLLSEWELDDRKVDDRKVSERKVGDWLSIFCVRTARKKRQAGIR